MSPPAGCGLNDSPVGLAAYILEKCSTWTDFNNRDLEDGGLERYKLQFSLFTLGCEWRNIYFLGGKYIAVPSITLNQMMVRSAKTVGETFNTTLFVPAKQ